MTERLRLFVVGESTPDMSKWSVWSEWSLVVAHDIEEALRLDGRGYRHGSACELPMTTAEVLVTMPEPNMGKDL